MTPSEYDKAHVRDILQGEGDWFGAMLLRLIAHADTENLELLRQIYPEHVDLYERWLWQR